MTTKPKATKTLFYLVLLAGFIALIYVSRAFYLRNATIHELLTDNKQLKQAITKLTSEDQIGYAKVISQEHQDEKLFTKIKFVETARNNKLEQILEKECTIEGDIVHFDSLIVKFGDKMVMDGNEKALYLWRRVYGEKTRPEDAFPIEQPGAEPKRYEDLLKFLPIDQRELFWSSIWDLANDLKKLNRYGITAIYGNAIYFKLRPGLIYFFKISPTGQVYPETVPDM